MNWLKALFKFLFGAAKQAGIEEAGAKINKQEKEKIAEMVEEAKRIADDPDHDPDNWH